MQRRTITINVAILSSASCKQYNYGPFPAQVTQNCTDREYLRVAAVGRRLHTKMHTVRLRYVGVEGPGPDAWLKGGTNVKMATLPPDRDLISCAIDHFRTPFCPQDVMAEVHILRRRLGRQLSCLDVGANLGSCGIMWLAERLCHTVVFYEPNPVVAALLNWTLTHNQLPGRAILRVAAASNAAGRQSLSIARGNAGHSTIGQLAKSADWSQEEERVRVQTVRLGDEAAVRDLGTVDVMKLDVEGTTRLHCSSPTHLVLLVCQMLISSNACATPRVQATSAWPSRAWARTSLQGVSPSSLLRRMRRSCRMRAALCKGCAITSHDTAGEYAARVECRLI